MNILPHERFELRTSLSQDEILKRKTVNTMYKGKAKDNTFEVQRIIDYRNSFLPSIKGVVQPAHKGSQILVTMKLHKLVIAFMAVWFAIVVVFAVVFMTMVDIEPTENISYMEYIFKYIPLIMIFMGAAICYFAFKKESKISRQDLKNILEAEDIYNKLD